VIRFASLGSGSKGNALLVQSGKTRVLIDCGFGVRALSERLARLGTVLDQLDAVLVTHEHSDHSSGLAALQKRTGCPVYLSAGTYSVLTRRQTFSHDVLEVTAGVEQTIGDLTVMPYAVPHDAEEPLQYVLGDGVVRLGMLTDAGSVTDAMCRALAGCEGLVLEYNHDVEMLATGSYPAFLKRRIAGPYGHLDNDMAADLLAQLKHDRLQHVLAAHLSETNNTPDHVRRLLSSTLGLSSKDVCVANQSHGHGWLTIGGRT